MKLNNRGWGTTEMLLLSGGLFLALIIAIVFISELYGSFETSLGAGYYIDVENKLALAAQEYIDKENITVTNKYIISLKDLQKKLLIGKLVDQKGKKCDGYAIVENDGTTLNYHGYISCKNYKTADYDINK